MPPAKGYCHSDFKPESLKEALRGSYVVCRASPRNRTLPSSEIVKLSDIPCLVRPKVLQKILLCEAYITRCQACKLSCPSYLVRDSVAESERWEGSLPELV